MRSKQCKGVAAAMLAAPLSGVLVSGSALAEGDIAVTPVNGDTATLDKVVVTGSRQKRSVGKSAAPIDVISASDLQKSGAANLTEALNEILPSFNLPAITGYDQSAIVRPAALRGLNADQTLVLVNGKRRHASAIVNVNAYVNRGSEPVDLNLIPFNSIDHVEVLRDGAAAQYGSDAIAGVINIILKSDTDGGDASAKVGGYGWKDGLTFQGSVDKGFAVGHDGFLDLSFEHFSQNHTDRSAPTSGPYYFPLPNGSPDPRESTVDADRLVADGLPDSRTYNFAYNAGFALNEQIKLYSFSTYSFRHAKGYEFFRYANDGNKDPTYNYDPVTGSYTQVYPSGYEPNEVIDENDFSVTAGAKGRNLWGWSWDFSSTYGKDDASISVVNTMNATLGPSSPHAFYAGSWINAELTNNLDFVRAFNVGLPAPLNVAFGGEHRNGSFTLKPGSYGSYALGPFTSVPGPDPGTGQPALDPYTPTPGAQSFPGFNPAIASNDYRDSFAGYVDFETQLLPKLDTGIAARFEHYDDFGNTTTGKLSLRYQLTRNYAVRGTVSNGFRAPALGQSHYAATTTNFFNGVAFQVGTFPVASPISVAFGATPLKPEKSVNYTVGLVASPVKNLDVTLDLYRIYVRNRIIETGVIGPQAYPTNDPNNPGNDYLTDLLLAAGLDPTSAANTSVQYFTNAVSTRTQGADLVAGYKLSLHEYGTLRLSVEGNLSLTSITSLGGVPAALQPVKQAYPDFQLIDSSSQGFITVGAPHNKLILGAQYMKGAYRLNLRETRFGQVTDTSNMVYGGPSTTVPATWITDLDTSYDLTPSITLGLGATNLFNHYPPKTSPDFQNFVGEGFGQYDGLTPYGYFGGFYYGRISYHF